MPAGDIGCDIACDESGWEGANLVAGNSDVIAYASVRLSAEAAADCLREVGGRAGALAREYKAAHALRADRRPTVTRLLGLLPGKARVHLTDKVFFVVGRVLDLILGESAEAASAGLAADPRLTGFAATLSRDGPEAFGPQRWRAFLTASNDVLRPKLRYEPVDAFAAVVETLADTGVSSRLQAILDELRGSLSVVATARARLVEHRMLQPAGEPLIPALASTVRYWSRDGETDVSIVHDEQSALTERRIRRLERQLLRPGRSLRFRQVDSRTDPRVQVADVLAGVARILATDELHGRGDPELGALLGSYVDPASCWLR